MHTSLTPLAQDHRGKFFGMHSTRHRLQCIRDARCHNVHCYSICAGPTWCKFRSFPSIHSFSLVWIKEDAKYCPIFCHCIQCWQYSNDSIHSIWDKIHKVISDVLFWDISIFMRRCTSNFFAFQLKKLSFAIPFVCAHARCTCDRWKKIFELSNTAPYFNRSLFVPCKRDWFLFLFWTQWKNEISHLWLLHSLSRS